MSECVSVYVCVCLVCVCAHSCPESSRVWGCGVWGGWGVGCSVYGGSGSCGFNVSSEAAERIARRVGMGSRGMFRNPALRGCPPGCIHPVGEPALYCVLSVDDELSWWYGHLIQTEADGLTFSFPRCTLQHLALSPHHARRFERLALIMRGSGVPTPFVSRLLSYAESTIVFVFADACEPERFSSRLQDVPSA